MTYKYLIIGSNGFIGKNIINELHKTISDENLYCLSRGKNIHNYKNFISCDISDYQQVKENLKKLDIDVVLYLSAKTEPSREMDDYEEFYKVNVEGMKNILEVLCYKNLKKFIYFSTCEVYGSRMFEPNETTVKSPISVYSLTKSMAEELLIFYINRFDLPVTIARLPLIYGKEQNERFFIPQAIKKLKVNQDFDMTKGEQTRDFLYIDDLIDVINEIIKRNLFVGEIINISTNTEVSIKTIILILKKLLGSKSRINFGSIDYRHNEIMRYKIDNSKLCSTLGRRISTKIEKSLENII